MRGTWPEIVQTGSVEPTGEMTRQADLLAVHLLVALVEETRLIENTRYGHFSLSNSSSSLMFCYSNSCKNCPVAHLLGMVKLLSVSRRDQVAMTRATAMPTEKVNVISSLGSVGLLVPQLRGLVVEMSVDAAMITLLATVVLLLPGLPVLVVAVTIMGTDSSLEAMALLLLVLLVELLPGNSKLLHRRQVAHKATMGMEAILALDTAMLVVDILHRRTWGLLQVLVVVLVASALLLDWVRFSRITALGLLEARHLLHLLVTFLLR